MESEAEQKRTLLKKKKMVEAMVTSLGIVSKACESVGISRDTHYKWLEKDKDYATAINEIVDRALDFAESKLFQLINGVTLPDDKVFLYKGKPVVSKGIKQLPPDTTAIIFYLKTKGKKRGYIEKSIMGFEDGSGKEITAMPSIIITREPTSSNDNGSSSNGNGSANGNGIK